MQAILDQVLDILRGVWRFRWPAMIAAWAVCLVGWLAVLAMPDMYEAKARVFVDTRTALTPVIQGIAIGQDVNAQLNYVQQSLLGGPQLERLAREADFQAATPQERASLVTDLRERVTLSAAGPGRGEPGGTVYTISFQDRGRERALKVVDILMNTFVEETLGGKKSGSIAAQQFLQQQITDYEGRLRQAEQRLAEFKRKNVGLMPGADGDYFSRLQGEIDAEKKAQTTLAIAMTRRQEIERQLRGEAPFAASITMQSGGAGMQQDTPSRIKETQAKLDELLLRFTDKHPDVVALRETLEELHKRRQAEIEALRRRDPGAVAGASSNPVYQNIQLALNEVDVEVAALRREITDRQDKIAQLRRMVDTAPEVEAEYARLNRDYDITRTQYGALVERLEKARIGEDAEATGSVRFEVIDPPNSPFAPVAPNRTRLLAMVLMAGLGIGGGIAFLLHQLKPVFTSSRLLNEVTGLPVLGTVSMTWVDRYAGQMRRAYAVYAGVGATLLIVFALTVGFNAAGSQLIRQIIGPAGST